MIKIPVMSQKRRKTLAAVAAALSIHFVSADVKAEVSDPSVLIPVIEITGDKDPLEVIKEEVIRYEAECGRLSLSSIDIEKSTVSVSSYDKYAAGLDQATVSLFLVSDDEDGETVTSIASSYNEQVLLHTAFSDIPEITLKEESIRIKKNADFDPTEYIASISDVSGNLPVLSVDTDLDTSKDGVYTVTYTVTNQSGRSARASLEAEVYTPRPVPGTNVDLSTLMINDDGSVEAMFAAINAVRAEYGLYPYVLAGDGGQTALAIRAQECTYFLSHTRPDGTSYHTVMDQIGVPHGSMVWEILVACGSTVESNLGWWLNSPGHRAAVLGTFGSTIAIGHCGNVWAAMVY